MLVLNDKLDLKPAKKQVVDDSGVVPAKPRLGND